MCDCLDSVRFVPLAAGLLVVTAACGQPSPQSEGASGAEREPLPVAVDLAHETVVETSVLRFELRGTERIGAKSKSARVEFLADAGDFPDVETFYSARLTRDGDVGDLVVELPVERSLWGDLQPENGEVFDGEIRIEVFDDIGVRVRGHVEEAQLTFRPEIAPSVETLESNDLYVNEELGLEGDGFLRPDEGETVAIVGEGTLDPPDAAPIDLSGERLQVQWTGSREAAVLVLEPDVFGVQPSTFDIEVQFRNELSNGRSFSGSESVGLEGTFEQSYIAELAPGAASRGQHVTIRGRGFVPTGEYDNIGMVLRFEGTFEPDAEDEQTRDYTGRRAIERSPTRVRAEDTIRQTVWYSVTDDRRLEGLGATPGRFEGTITPILLDGQTEQEGTPWEGTFRVLPTRQVVYLKYLPAFSRALETYGLRNVEGAIRDRVATVVERDYADYHVDVREERPEDFADFATVELGGPDPTGSRSFGYDNSFNGVAKDTGNLYLADYLGGVNADAAEEFNNPYGGIFIASFTFFSAELSPDNPHASEKFDEILRPFMPELGGTPVRGTEWPEGPRSDAIERAIQMVGSVIGNTVTHEVGHSLGMTYVEGDFDRPQDVFHNQIPGAYIMDPGAERPFAERAELPGTERARFSPLNRSYLERILPQPE